MISHLSHALGGSGRNQREERSAAGGEGDNKIKMKRGKDGEKTRWRTANSSGQADGPVKLKQRSSRNMSTLQIVCFYNIQTNQ